jgi:hypothetical protein
MCLRRVPEKYIAGAALDRAGLEFSVVRTSSNEWRDELEMTCKNAIVPNTISTLGPSELLATDPEVPGSIPGATKFSEKYWLYNGVHSASWVQLRSYMEDIVAAQV